LIKKRGKQRTDSTHVIAAVHTLTRLEIANETLRHALNGVAEVEPAWLKAHLDPIWFERYSERLNGYRLPKKDSEREALAEVIGQDGYRLLSIIYADDAPSHLRYLPAIEILRQVWVQMYYIENDQVQWRSNKNIPPSARVIRFC
jgi:transposase